MKKQPPKAKLMPSKKPIRVAVTGGAGNLAYSLLFRIAAGDLFGLAQPVSLHILEVPEVLKVLDGVVMELEDCAFPLLRDIKVGSDPFALFKDINVALLVGAKPRGPGMERKDLLIDNAKIFVEQGKALNESASDDLLTLVVGNPCNTNCLITSHLAKRFQKTRFHAMTRLDQNRATSLLAKKANKQVLDVSQMTIWGNHSNTQVPDFSEVRIEGQPIEKFITDKKWLEETFVSDVQTRGAKVISARGKSSAASAASAIVDAVRSLTTPSQNDNWFSSAWSSDGNPYGIQEGLIFSFPTRNTTQGFEIVKGLKLNSWLQEKLKVTEKELLDERALVSHLIK